MTLESGFQRLRRINEFVLASDKREEILNFLSENICPLGEVSGAGMAILSQNGWISALARYGFTDSIPQPPDVKLTDRHPAAEAFRNMEMKMVSLDGIRDKYPDINKEISERPEYKTAIWLPVTQSILYGFALMPSKRSLDRYQDYFACVGSTLLYWENFHQFKIGNNHEERISDDRPFTERQREIVELIKQGYTNIGIGSILGYSESLIRQETIVIYRKLGVDGRNGLLDHPRMGHRSNQRPSQSS